MAERIVRVRLAAVVSDYEKGMRAAAQATHEVGTEAEKLAQQKQAFQQLGATGLTMGAILSAGLAMATKASMDFDAQMSNVKAATHETAENMDLLRQAALDAGESTVYSATEAAQAIEELSKAGVSTADILSGGLTGALDLAAAGGLEVADAAGIAATALKQFNLEGSDMAHVADLLAAGAGKAMGDVSDLSQALNQSALIAKQTGISIEETTAGLAAFASQGLIGSDAGTSFKSMLQSLNPTSAAAAGLMEKYNIQAFDAQGNFVGLAQYAGRLKEGLSGLSTEQQNATLKTIFGSDAVRAATVLYQQGSEGITEWTEAVDDQGYAASTAAMRLDNLKGDVEALGGAFETALIDTGSTANDTLRTMVQAITGLIGVYNDLPTPVQGTVMALGGAAAAVALTGGAAFLAVPKWLEFKATVEASTWTMKGIGFAAGGAAAVLGGLFLVVGELAASHQRAQQKAQSYADTLADGTHDITDATRELIATSLTADQSFLWISQGSLADNAETLGLSISTVTDAISGNVEALEEVQTALQKGIDEGYKPSKDANLELYDAAVLLQTGIEGEIGALDKATEKARQSEEATKGSAEAAGTAAEAYQAEADTIDDLNSQLTGLINKINEANGVAVDAITANSDYLSALDGLASQAEKLGFSLDESTVSGSANAAAMGELSDKARAAAEAQFEQDLATMSADDAAKKYAATLADQRQAFIDSAVAAGYNADEVKALADRIFQMPPEKHIDMLVETAQAQNKIDKFITLNNGKRVKVFVDAEGGQSFKVGSKTVSANAAGAYYSGGVKAFANSGFEPGIYPYTSGGIHKMAEEYDEAYISLDPARRNRSEAVWVKTGQEMGMFSGGAQQAPSLTGLGISGTLEIGGDGLARIINGHIVSYDESATRTTRGGVRP